MSESPFVSSKRGLIRLQQQSESPLGAADLSVTLGPHELQRLMKSTPKRNSSSYNATAMTAAADVMSISERSMLDGNSLQQQRLFQERADVLFPQFLEVLQSRTHDSEVFDTIQDLIQTCAGVLEETQRELQRSVTNVKQRLVDAVWLQQEMNTWKLLYVLYKDRVLVQSELDGMDVSIPPLGASEKEVIAQLYAGNSELREYQLVVDWLEACYDRPENYTQVGHSSDRSVAWENTLFQLQTQRDVAFGSGVEIVKSLDPDAPVRERRPLHALDEEDKSRLSKCIFTEIRQGRIDEAMSLCKYSGQPWRAAILEGWRLHEDPNYESNPNTREKLPIEGNPRRDIWKKCAWMMADSKKYDDFTRAIAGVFCGHLDSLKALIGNNWEDLLWAYLKVQIDIRVESEIRACCIKPYHPMPEQYWNGKMSLEKIFEELTAHSDAAVRDYANSKIGTIQKHLILDNIPELMLQMRRWVEDASCDTPQARMSPHFLRFLSHIVLFLRQIGRIDNDDTANSIIAAYIDCLIKFGDAQLVAFYTSALPGKLQVQLYSKFLGAINDSTERAKALDEANNVGLDTENITRQAVINLSQLTAVGDEANQALQAGVISEFDRRKIRALEWLIFEPSQRGELLWQANGMIRYFMGEGKMDCVKKVYEMVPDDAVGVIIGIYGSLDNLPWREAVSIKEYLSYKVYLVALDHFNAYMGLYYNKPSEPQLLRGDANFTERIASELKEQAYRDELNRWEMILEEQSKVARDAFFNILLFPDKGWLQDPDLAQEPEGIKETDWQNRQIQLEKLRSIYIPEVVMLLHQVMYLSGDYKGCVSLANELASEDLQLYRIYSNHKLYELLAKLAESSLDLMNQKMDSFGYTATI